MIRRLLMLAVCLPLLLAAAPARSQSTEELRIVMVTHGAASDPFWAMVKAGADAAARTLGVAVDYRAPERFDVAAMARLVEQAIDEKPHGLVVSIPNADALAPQLRRAADAGLPVISINSGFDVSASLGVRLHVGQNEYEAGRAAGRRMRELGGRRAVCINHETGNIGLDLRCKGFIDAFEGSVEVLPVEPDQAKVRAAVAERLEKERSVDVVLGLSAVTAGEAALAAVADAGRQGKVQVGTFDLSEAVLRAVADGRMAFAVDQQPFLQGYLPVDFLALYRRDGAMPVSDVRTGPSLVEQEEAQRRLDAAAAPAR